MDYYFKTKKMSVGYEGCTLIKDIQITLEKGEILTLIGPNGAGKSTILKSIARQLALVEGVIYLNQKSMLQMSGKELSQKMAVLLTDKLRTEWMTCADVVATGRYPYTGHFGVLTEMDKEIVKEAMEVVAVSEIKNRDFTQISDGQRQRVLLARAICQEPEIIILDEPTSYLDIKYKLEFISILQQMKRKKGLTVILSLHELELAARVSDKILCIKDNAIDCFGTPEEVFVPGYITKLFEIETGSFDERSGNMELHSAMQTPEVFVIAGGGTGRSTYRRLQREGISFYTGILYENDLDYPVANGLAYEVIEAESFEPMTEKQLEIAKQKVASCKSIICCKDHFGTLDTANETLLQYAKQCGKAIERERG